MILNNLKNIWLYMMQGIAIKMNTNIVKNINGGQIVSGIPGNPPSGSSVWNDSLTYIPVNTICGRSLSYGTSSYGYSWLDVGFGDTPETPDDYCLADSNYANHKLTCIVMARQNSIIGDLLNIYGNFRNDGSENVIVKEIGFVGNPASNGSADNLLLFTRKVLDSPVTIAPGEIYNFSYRIKFKN